MSRTLQDIADKAGVSPSTVSRVLSGSDHPVGEETRSRVLRAAKELNFTPNAFARGLSKGESHFIGLVVPDIRDPYFVEIARGTEDLASQRDHLVVLCNTDRDPVKEQCYIEELSALRAGIILAGGGVYRNDRIVDIEGYPAPVVTIGRPTRAYSSIQIDTRQGAIDAVAHLVEIGRRRIAFFSGPPSQPSSIDRVNSFRAAMEVHGLPVEEGLIVNGLYTPEGGMAGMRKLLDGGMAPEAIFAGNDQMALGALKEARTRGIRIPEELAVIGFNGIVAAEESYPPLTTVKLALREMGRMAADMLLRERTDRQTEPTTVVVKGRLVVRASTVAGPAR